MSAIVLHSGALSPWSAWDASVLLLKNKLFYLSVLLLFVASGDEGNFTCRRCVADTSISMTNGILLCWFSAADSLTASKRLLYILI